MLQPRQNLDLFNRCLVHSLIVLDHFDRDVLARTAGNVNARDDTAEDSATYLRYHTVPAVHDLAWSDLIVSRLIDCVLRQHLHGRFDSGITRDTRSLQAAAILNY